MHALFIRYQSKLSERKRDECKARKGGQFIIFSERKRNVHQQTRTKQTARHQAEFEFKSKLSFLET